MASLNEVDILEMFGRNLLRLRRQRGFSQRDLAAECGIDNADISRIENAKKDITLRTLRSLSDGLGCYDFELLVNYKTGNTKS